MNDKIFQIFLKRVLTFSISAIFATAFGLTTVSAQMSYTLTVNKVGGGVDNGTVTSTPFAINCGANCSADFNQGEMVTLTPTTIAGSFVVFRGWSGACNNTGTCVVTMDQAKSVTARFEKVIYQKCTAENPSQWGLRFRLTGANVNVNACQARCLAGGGNGNFAINGPLGWCVCGTDRQPESTRPALPNGECGETCPFPYTCGGTVGQYSVYSVPIPTVAAVFISGRVFTDDGRGLVNAMVYLTDQNGEIRAARTNTFGYYRFDEIEVGQIVLVSVSSKRYQFAPQVVTVLDELTEINFTAQ